MTTPFSSELFEALPVVGILRGFDLFELEGLLPASFAGGLTNIEITMNSPGAPRLIQEAKAIAGTRMNVGAGTVLSPQLLDEAIEAGACFIVTPTVEAGVIRSCVQSGIPVFPGALSPTEIHRAWDMGAAMVKVFPAEIAGPSYVRSVKAPLPHIKLLPTGGVTIGILPDYIRAGADGFGVGSPLFAKERVAARDWDWITAQCRAFHEAYWREKGLAPRQGV